MMNMKTIIYDDLPILLWWNIIKTTVTNCLKKCHHCIWIWQWGPYIADDEHEDDHMMSSPYLCDETSEKQPLAIASKSVTTAYEFGTWGPFSRWWTQRWSYMMTIPYLFETSSKQHLQIASKSVTTAYEFGTWGPIRDVMMNWWSLFDDLTILFYQNIIKNNNYQ